MQVQAQMTFGGGLAAAMLGPVQTAGDELNGGGVHQVDGALEAEGELGPTPMAEAGVNVLQVCEDGPEKVLRQLGWALAVGGGEPVLARAAGAANGRERARVQAQGIADVIEAEGVGELGEEQTHDMTPR